MTETTRPDRILIFSLGAILAACAVLGLYIWTTSAEWFVGDDFDFLYRVQRPWSWIQVFFPLKRAFWWAYRPLGMDSFFYLGFKLFRWNAGGFYGVAVAVRALTGVVSYRLARQLGFEFPAAVTAALLSVSRFPSISNAALACAFHYTAAIFFHALALSLFFDYLRKRRWFFQAAACLSFTAGLLCNELVLTLPFLLLLASAYDDGFRPRLAQIGRTLLVCWPYFALSVLFLLFRYRVIAQMARPPLYAFTFGWHILDNSIVQLRQLTGHGWNLLAALALMALLAATLFRIGRGGGGAWGHIARVWVIGLAWLLAVLLPLSALPFPMDRFAAPAEIPAALLFSVLVDAIWKAYKSSHALLLQIALPVLILTSLPWAEVRLRVEQARGPYMKAFQQVVAKSFPRPLGRKVIKILYGGTGRADAQTAELFRYESFRGLAIYDMYPDEPIMVRYEDVTATDPRRILCANCYYLNLLPSFRVEPISGEALYHSLFETQENRRKVRLQRREQRMERRRLQSM
jgi:hypothetical protein